MKNKDLLLNVSKIPSIEEQINDNQYDVSKLNNYLGGIYNNRFSLFKGIINDNTYSTVINDVPVRYFNLDKTLDGLTLFDTLFVNIRYTKDNVEKTYNSYTTYNTNFNYFNIIMEPEDFNILIKIIPDKQVNENFEEVVAEGKSYFYIKYTKTTTEETRNMLDNAYIELIVSNNNILKMDNKVAYTPTSDYNPSTKKYVDDTSKELQIDDDFRTAIAYNQAAAIKDKSIVIFDNKLSGNISYSIDPDYSDENNKIQGKCAININKTLDSIGVNDILSAVFKYKVNGEYNILKLHNKVASTTGVIQSCALKSPKMVFRVYANRKINSDFTETEDANYCAILITFAYSIPVETIIEIRDSLELYVDLCSLNTLTLDNEEEFIPTGNYNPATKKYVDDKKYNDLIEKPITVLPYETTVSNDVVYKNSAINVATLEAHKIYMTAPDVTNLFLQVEKLDGTLIAQVFFLAKSSGSILLQTGFKNDKKIEIMIEGTVHTFYFKTDTEEPRVERTVRYLTSNNTIAYTPTSDYHPTTKKYVDDRSPFKSITSTADNVIIINELQTNNLYELNGTFKMFSSSESIKLSGLFIFENIDNNTKALRKINNNGNITTRSYILDIITQTYNINRTQEINYLIPENNFIYLENVTSGIYSTAALSARVNKSNDASVALGVAGIKYLAITKASYNGDTIWTINVLGSIMSNSELTLKSDGTVVAEFYQYQTDKNILTKDNTKEYIPTEDYHPSTKKYVDNTITEQISSSQATDEEVDAMLQAVLGGDYSNEQ